MVAGAFPPEERHRQGEEHDCQPQSEQVLSVRESPLVQEESADESAAYC